MPIGITEAAPDATALRKVEWGQPPRVPCFEILCVAAAVVLPMVAPAAIYLGTPAPGEE
jgi:hypothetical protein